MSSNDRAKSVDLVFNSGVRQDLEPTTAPLGTLVRAENLEFDKLGNLIRRAGFESIGTTTYSKAQPLDFPVQRLAQTPRGERLLFTNKNSFLHFRSPNKVSEAGLQDQFSTVRVTVEGAENIVSDEVGAIYTCDAAYVAGFYVVAYAQLDATSGLVNLYVDAIDISTNGRVVTHLPIGVIDQGVQPRVVVCGGTAAVFVLWKSGTNLNYAKFDFGGGGFLTGTLVTDVNAAPPGACFDADGMVSGIVIVYGQSVGPKARIITVNSAAAITNSFSWLANGGVNNWVPSQLCIHGDIRIANQVRAAGYEPGGNFLEMEITTSALVHSSRARVNPGLGAAQDVTQMTIIAASANASLLLFSNYTSFAPENPRGHLYVYYVTAGSLTSQTTYAHYSLASKCYRDNRNDTIVAFGRFNDPSGLQSHILCLDFGTALFGPYPTFHLASGRVPLFADNAYTGIGGIADLGSGQFRLALPLNIGASSISGNQVASYSLQCLGTRRFLNSPANNELHIGGGTPLVYDGQRMVENSFYSYPIIGNSSITKLAVGGFMPQGVYSYAAVYEWTDALGNRHQSPACPSFTIDMSAGGFAANTNQVIIGFPCYHPTRKQVPLGVDGIAADTSSPVRVIIYRSVSNGSILYRMPIASINNTASTANNTLVGDVYSDAQISVNEVLYCGPQGRGELATSAPPPTKFLHTHAQRLWGVDNEYSERIWCTKTLEQAVNPGYNAGLQILIPGAGTINGLAGQDGKLYALATNGIYLASYGDGPDNAGNGGFPTPQLITAASNCTEPRSVLLGSNGIYFVGDDQWGQGIYLIRRGDGEPIPIGKRVRDALATLPVCRGVVDRVDKSRIEFLFVDSDTAATHSALLYYHYDYLDAEGIGQWTVNPIGEGIGLEPPVPFGTELTCVALWNDGANNLPTTAVSTLANVAVQRALVLNDVGVDAFSTTIETADIRAFGLLGYGRICGVSLLNTAYIGDTLTIEASYDSGFSWPDSHAFGSSTEGGGQPVLRRWDTRTSKLPEGGSVRFRITDPPTSPTSFDVGSQFYHGLSLEVEPLGGNARLGNVKRG